MHHQRPEVSMHTALGVEVVTQSRLAPHSSLTINSLYEHSVNDIATGRNKCFPHKESLMVPSCFENLTISCLYQQGKCVDKASNMFLSNGDFVDWCGFKTFRKNMQ